MRQQATDRAPPRGVEALAGEPTPENAARGADRASPHHLTRSGVAGSYAPSPAVWPGTHAPSVANTEHPRLAAALARVVLTLRRLDWGHRRQVTSRRAGLPFRLRSPTDVATGGLAVGSSGVASQKLDKATMRGLFAMPELTKSPLERVIEKVEADQAFRDRLVADPKPTLKREMGIVFPDEVDVEVVQNTPYKFSVVLPIAPPDFDELEEVVGRPRPTVYHSPDFGDCGFVKPPSTRP